MLLRSIHRYVRFAIVPLRSFANTPVNSTDHHQPPTAAAAKLCQEYGRRMKAHLVRAESRDVLNLLDELMQKHQIKPNSANYLLAMQAINHSKQRSDADRLYNLIMQQPLVMEDGQIQIGLVYMYAVAIGDISYAEKLAGDLEKPHINVFSTLMTGYIRQNRAEKAIELYHKIDKDDRLTHNMYSYNAMLNACTKLGHFTEGKEIIQQILANNDPILVQNTTLVTTMIDLLGKGGNGIELCIRLFQSIKVKQRTSFLYSAMMKAYNKSDMPRQTLKLFDQIVHEDGHGHDFIHFILVFNACAKLGRVALRNARILYQTMLQQSAEYVRHPRCRNASIDMFGKCADAQTAQQIFDANQDLNDVVSWGAILNTYALHADGRRVLDLFDRMQRETTIKPNTQIYTTVLNACTHSGLLDQANVLFTRYKIDLPDLWKYVIMIDALARADQLDEAFAMIDQYESTHPPSMTMYMSMLSCARSRGLIAIAEKVIKRLESISSFRSEDLKPAYVLLANLYNAQGHREEAFRIRQKMREKKLTKVPGLTWIDINGITHEFRANDRRHNQTREIYAEVARIDEELKEDGHIVDLNSVPLGSVHSEKLAMALAFIETPVETPVVLTKNLRICSDCHEIANRLSRLRKREIVIRDSFRALNVHVNVVPPRKFTE